MFKEIVGEKYGICPHCGAEVEYFDGAIDDDYYSYLFECNSCGKSGTGYFDLIFSHNVILELTENNTL